MPRSKSLASALVIGSFTVAIGVSWLWLVHGAASSGDWEGVDEAVIGRLVASAGVRGPAFALDWVRGDLLLFMFLCAGLTAGFVLGYHARTVCVEQRELTPRRSDEP
jgi:hypothetical protein